MTPQPRQNDEVSHTFARIKAGVLPLGCGLIGRVDYSR